jgi:hypothetical protein
LGRPWNRVEFGNPLMFIELDRQKAQECGKEFGEHEVK